MLETFTYPCSLEEACPPSPQARPRASKQPRPLSFTGNASRPGGSHHPASTGRPSPPRSALPTPPPSPEDFYVRFLAMLLEKSFLWAKHCRSCFGQYTLKEKSSLSFAVPRFRPSSSFNEMLAKLHIKLAKLVGTAQTAAGAGACGQCRTLAYGTEA